MELGERAGGAEGGGKLLAFVASEAIPGDGPAGEASGEEGAQGSGEPAEELVEARGEAMAVVPPEELIATISAESHGQATASGFAADEVGGELGGVGEGLAVEARQGGDQGAGIGGGEGRFAVVGAEMGGDGPGEGSLVKAGGAGAGIGKGAGGGR